MSIKNLFKRFVCIMIVIGLVVPELQLQSFATVVTSTVRIELDPVVGYQSTNPFDLAEMTEEVLTEPNVMINTHSSHNNWWILRNYDHLPYNEIHNRVQNHIWNNLENSVDIGEYTINYEDGSYGRADIYENTSDIIYLWEVKPPSYRDVNKQKGLDQLSKYVNEGIGDFEFGDKSSISIKNSDFSFNLILRCNKGTESWTEFVTYFVDYEHIESGLIVYDFTRSAVKVKDPEEESKENSNSGESNLGGDSGTGSGSDENDSSEGKYENPEADPDDTELPWWIIWFDKGKGGTGSGSGDGTGSDEGLGSGNPPITQTPGDKEDEEEEGDVAAIVIPVLVVGGVVVTAGVVYAVLTGSDLSSLKGWKETLAAVPAMALVITNNATIAYAEDGTEIYELPDTPENKAAVDLIYEAQEIVNTLDLMEGAEGYDDDEIEEKLKEKDKEFRNAENQPPQRDPLIIHFGSEENIVLTTLDNGVYFDLDNNGFAEKTAWIGSEEGFLALDVNENNRIDNGGELFGDKFKMPDGKNIVCRCFMAVSYWNRWFFIINNNCRYCLGKRERCNFQKG